MSVTPGIGLVVLWVRGGVVPQWRLLGGDAREELAHGGYKGGDAGAELVFGGFGAFGLIADRGVGAGDRGVGAGDRIVCLEREGRDGGVCFVDLALGVAPELTVFLSFFAALFIAGGYDVFDAAEAFFKSHFFSLTESHTRRSRISANIAQ